MGALFQNKHIVLLLILYLSLSLSPSSLPHQQQQQFPFFRPILRSILFEPLLQVNFPPFHGWAANILCDAHLYSYAMRNTATHHPHWLVEQTTERELIPTENQEPARNTAIT